MVGHPQTQWWFHPQSVSGGRLLTVNVCGLAHRGLVCSFLVVLLQIAIDTFALFHRSVFDCMRFTVMFHR